MKDFHLQISGEVCPIINHRSGLRDSLNKISIALSHSSAYCEQLTSSSLPLRGIKQYDANHCLVLRVNNCHAGAMSDTADVSTGMSAGVQVWGS